MIARSGHSASGKNASSAALTLSAMSSKTIAGFWDVPASCDSYEKCLVGRGHRGSSRRGLPGNPPPMSSSRSWSPSEAARVKTLRAEWTASKNADASVHPEPTWKLTPMTLRRRAIAPSSRGRTASSCAPNFAPSLTMAAASETWMRSTSSASGNSAAILSSSSNESKVMRRTSTSFE
eukprot:Amastigsp_a686159_5.p3 type:complete len:178 gc:universal Amastigsp_a686159_5:467-1000(+)